MRTFLTLTMFLLAACGGGEGREPAPEKPNLILIIGDDQAYYDFGFMGSPHVQTPRLDRLAEEGATFPFGYTTASICRPALVSLLTGLQPFQWYFRLNQLRRLQAKNAALPDIRRLDAPKLSQIALSEIQRIETLPRLLTEQGYATFQAGKYWEGPFDLAGFTHGMAHQRDRKSLRDMAGGKESLALMRSTMEPVYHFIDKHVDKPFFIWFAPMLPHAPHDPPKEFLDLYSGADLSRAAKAYYANISRFDAGVGDLVDYLESKGLRGGTLIAYVVDNGWQLDESAGSRIALQGGPKGKMSLYEVGFRTPILLNAPGWIPAGLVNNGLVSSVDLYATFLDYAGAPQRSDRPGLSLRPVLEGREEIAREVIIGNMNLVRADMPGEMKIPQQWSEPVPKGSTAPVHGGFFLRDSRWHYIWYEDRKHELYDVNMDPKEEHNVADDYPEVTERFRARIVRWKAEMARPFETKTDKSR